MMRISRHGLEKLKEFEGHKNRMYKDTGGKWTIGIGHLITKTELQLGLISILGEEVTYRNGLTDQQVLDLLDQDLDRFENAVNDYVKVHLKQNEFDTLVSFAFNVGTGAFRSSTLLKRLNAGKKEEVPAQLRRWVYDDGKKIQGLVNRREKEIEMWGTPVENKLRFVGSKECTVCIMTEEDGTQHVELKGLWRNE